MGFGQEHGSVNIRACRNIDRWCGAKMGNCLADCINRGRIVGAVF